MPPYMLGNGFGDTLPEPLRIGFVRRDGGDVTIHARSELVSAFDEQMAQCTHGAFDE